MSLLSTGVNRLIEKMLGALTVTYYGAIAAVLGVHAVAAISDAARSWAAHITTALHY